jgi:hypothetical protein
MGRKRKKGRGQRQSNKPIKNEINEVPKKRSGRKFLIALFALLIGVPVAMHYMSNEDKVDKPKAAQVQITAPAPQVRKAPPPGIGLAVFNEAFARHQSKKDTYWLTGKEAPQEFITKTKAKTAQIIKAMRRCAEGNGMATELFLKYKGFRISQYYRGSSRTFQKAPTPVNGKVDWEKYLEGLEFCVIPKDEYERAKLPAMVFYRDKWRALMVLAIDMPEKFMTALVFHELGHALRHQQGRPSATATAGSDSYISEEVEMHALEDKILNYSSGGKLFTLYKKILARAKTKDPTKVASLIAKEDIATYEKLFDLDEVGPKVINLCYAQFLVGLGFYAIGDEDPAHMAKKIKYYRFQRWGTKGRPSS